jgi:hypothetical protein
MFAKASTLFAIFAVAARVAASSPPACLLAAVNTCENPADIKEICSKESDKVTSYLTKNCGDYEDAATKWFKETCEDAGETISGGSSNSSSSSTASHSGSKTATASGTLSTASGNSTESSHTITGASTFATGISGAASGTGSNGVYSTDSNNGTVLSTAGTAGPTTAGNAGTRPTSAAGTSSGSASSGAGRVGMEFAGLAAIGVVGAMLAL